MAISTAQEKSDAPPPWPILTPSENDEPLPGTEKLTLEGDLSHQLVEANDAFLDAQIAAARESRQAKWKSGSYDADQRREEMATMLGLDRDSRIDDTRFEFYSIQKAQLAVAEGLSIYTVRWQAIDGVNGEGLLLEPEGKKNPTSVDVIAIPDANQTPEELAGLAPNIPSETSPFALLLAQSGCRVLVPSLTNREENQYRMTNREWLHRPAFELGRHLLGYELHQVLAGVDALKNTATKERPLGVVGFGEGGLLSLYAGALDPRIQSVAVSGYFGPREGLWLEPAEHNIFGLLETFGDAEIASLVAPRALVIESGVYPDFVFRPDKNGAPEIIEERPEKAGKPGRFMMPSPQGVASETNRLREIAGADWQPMAVTANHAMNGETLAAFADGLGLETFDPARKPIAFKKVYPDPEGHDHIAERHARQMTAIERHTQRALIQSRQDRQEYFKELKTDTLEDFKKTIELYRDRFRTNVIGEFDLERIAANPRTRRYEEGPKTVSYEVVLDVFDGVIAYGILTLPKDLDLTSGEKRPVVVCQHGLEGTPQDVIGEPKFKAYAAFATRLAERGFITFAPQNGYRYFDLFRLQQFKSQSIGKTLFSLIVPQHLQITDWLAKLPFVDADRIAFYGLSYGGKSAMRIPPLVDRYCLSICAGDFNEWVWKNAATDPKSLRYSYANKGEYEIFEWNLGGTFNYAEMAALICPRPFMVERGHFDGVAPDEAVAYEFAKVRNLYQAQLGLDELCEIEWFPGPHKINGVGTYAFLEKHLGMTK
ncbi:MAG: hypothetical protein KDN19_21320 [Verrucomicrobiae bacterium]|nr:hypothetical protein [Verrucomicrobiae bacterium]